MSVQLIFIAWIVAIPLALFFAMYAVRMAIITYLDLADFYDKKNDKGEGEYE